MMTTPASITRSPRPTAAQPGGRGVPEPRRRPVEKFVGSVPSGCSF
jgi:hypothetical protein